jgi:glutamine synthetase
MEQDFSMHANPLVVKLQKPASEFTKADIVSYIKENGITMVNFMYPAADGRLKTLNFVISDAAYLDAILTCGERVDGSSLFPFIEAGSSDLYVIPRFCTAFIDPFAEQAADQLMIAKWIIRNFQSIRHLKTAAASYCQSCNQLVQIG